MTDPSVSLSLHALSQRLREAGLPFGPLEPMPVTGLAHHHVRIADARLVVRVPTWSQGGLDPWPHLIQEAEGFRRASAAGCTPALKSVLRPDARLPVGALVVSEIVGQPPELPAHLPLLASAFAAVHSLPVPPNDERAPLRSDRNAFCTTIALIEQRSSCFASIGLPSAARALLEEQVQLLRRIADDIADSIADPVLVLTDCHPGNFLIDAAGKAWFIDCEKVQYSTPALDLAHATLYTSTTWVLGRGQVLSKADVVRFVDDWRALVSDRIADQAVSVLSHYRRLVWLRTLSWMAVWRASRESITDQGLPESLRRHIRARIDDFFALPTLQRVRDDIDGFQL